MLLPPPSMCHRGISLANVAVGVSGWTAGCADNGAGYGGLSCLLIQLAWALTLRMFSARGRIYSLQ